MAQLRYKGRPKRYRGDGGGGAGGKKPTVNQNMPRSDQPAPGARRPSRAERDAERERDALSIGNMQVLPSRRSGLADYLTRPRFGNYAQQMALGAMQGMGDVVAEQGGQVMKNRRTIYEMMQQPPTGAFATVMGGQQGPPIPANYGAPAPSYGGGGGGGGWGGWGGWDDWGGGGDVPIPDLPKWLYGLVSWRT